MHCIYCMQPTFCEHRLIHRTTPEQSSHSTKSTGRLQIALQVFSYNPTLHDFNKLTEISCFKLSKLLPDIRYMQPGAECHSEYTSDVHSSPKYSKKLRDHAWRKWRYGGCDTVPRLVTYSLSLSSCICIHMNIYMYIYIFFHVPHLHLCNSESLNQG